MSDKENKEKEPCKCEIKDFVAFGEFSNGLNNIEDKNFNSAFDHLLKSSLFNYTDSTHDLLSIAVAECFMINLQKKNYEELKKFALIIEKDQKTREFIANVLRKEHVNQLKNKNFKESLKYLIQSYLLKPDDDIIKEILNICSYDFIVNFEKYVDSKDDSEEFKSYIKLLMNSSNKDKIKEIFSTYFNNKGAKFNNSDNYLMAEKYADLAGLLSNDDAIVKNINTVKQNLKNSNSNNKGYISYKDEEEYKTNKSYTEIMTSLNNISYINPINNWLKNNNILYKQNTFSDELKCFTSEYSKKSCFLDAILNPANKPIDIVNSLLNQNWEKGSVIGTGLKKLLYIELDYKNWTINIGTEYGHSFYKYIKRLFNWGISEDTNLYYEININLKPKNLKDIFSIDSGISKSATFNTPFFYISKTLSKSFIDNNDNDK